MPDTERPIEVAMLQTFVAGRDVACPGCGYNVRDLPGDVCPECGQRLRLSLGLVEPKQASLIAGLVGLAAGAGFGGLLVLYIVIMTVRFGDDFSSNEMRRILTVTGGGFVVHAAALAAWVAKWNRIRRLDAGPRWLLVAACGALPLAFVVIFSVTVR